jgi:hypothetical protein
MASLQTATGWFFRARTAVTRCPAGKAEACQVHRATGEPPGWCFVVGSGEGFPTIPADGDPVHPAMFPAGSFRVALAYLGECPFQDCSSARRQFPRQELPREQRHSPSSKSSLFLLRGSELQQGVGASAVPRLRGSPREGGESSVGRRMPEGGKRVPSRRRVDLMDHRKESAWSGGGSAVPTCR